MQDVLMLAVSLFASWGLIAAALLVGGALAAVVGGRGGVGPTPRDRQVEELVRRRADAEFRRDQNEGDLL